MTRNWMGMVSTTVFAVSLLSACSDAPVDIGEKYPTLSKSDLSAYAAVWTGYAEAFKFEDDSDQLRIVLDEQGLGSMRVGKRDLVGPATDPAAYYPPQNDSFTQKDPTYQIWSGLEYAVRDAAVKDDRIHFKLGTAEPFAGYCALQTPHVYQAGTSDEMYLCVSLGNNSPYTKTEDGCFIPEHPLAAGEDPDSVAKVEVGCQQLAMCERRVCACTATGCSIDASDSNVELDAALDDSQENLVGTLVMAGDRIVVRLERQ